MARKIQRIWTPAKIDEIVRLYTVERLDCSTIAARFDASAYHVKRALTSRNLEIRQVSPLAVGDRTEILRAYKAREGDVRALASRFGRSRDTIKRVLVTNGVATCYGNKGTPFTAEQRSEIVRRYANGEGLHAIAKDFRVSYHPIKRVLRESGIEIRDWRGVMITRRARDGFRCLPKSVFQRRKAGARNHGIAWTLTIDDINTQYTRQNGLCHYTKLPMKIASRDLDYSRTLTQDPLTLSVDRRDSDKGYAADNIVLCCRWVNYAKNVYTEEQFKSLLIRTAKNLVAGDTPEARTKTEDSLTA